MDLNGDGHRDLISGSYRGYLYYFENGGNGTFGERQMLRTHDGKEINLGYGGSVFAVDWDRDGDIDLLTGNMWGRLYLFPNESSGKGMEWGMSVPINLNGTNGEPIRDGYPCVADWDGDGNHDLLLGSTDGSVTFYRNTSDLGKPFLADPVELVPASPHRESLIYSSDPLTFYGIYSRICVGDWNGDGRMDLIMGVNGYSIPDPPDLSEEEKTELKEATEKQAAVMERYYELQYRARAKIREEMGIPEQEQLDVDRAYKIVSESMLQFMKMPELTQINKELIELISASGRYYSSFSRHGWVWVFLRKSDDQDVSVNWRPQ